MQWRHEGVKAAGRAWGRLKMVGRSRGGHVCDGAGREGSGQTLRGQSGRPGEEGRMWSTSMLWPRLCLLSPTPHSLGWVPAKPRAPQTLPSSGMRTCALSALPSLPMTPSPSSTYCWVQGMVESGRHKAEDGQGRRGAKLGARGCRSP